MLSLYRRAMTPNTAANIPPGNFNEIAAFGLGAAVVCESFVAEAVELVLVLVELVLVVNVEEEEELDSEVVLLEELLDVLPVDVEAELLLLLLDLVADALMDDAEPVVPEMENGGVKLILFGLVSSMISIV